MQDLLPEVSPLIKVPAPMARCLNGYVIRHIAHFSGKTEHLTHSPDEKGKTQCGNLMRAIEILQKLTISC